MAATSTSNTSQTTSTAKGLADEILKARLQADGVNNKTSSGSSSTEEESEEDKKKREAAWKTMKYTFIAFGVTFSALGVWVLVESGSPPTDPDGEAIEDEFSHLPIVQQYLTRCWSTLKTYNKMIREPSREKLLPDPLTEPYYQPPYTLVLEMTDILVHPDWTYQTGWRFKKRPGVDFFLSQVGPPLFEVVIYTAEQGFIIMVDWNQQSVKEHCRNALLLPRWKGNDDDQTLVELAVFLRTIASSEVEDVREVLDFYHQFDDPMEAFKQNLQKIQEQQAQLQKQKQDESKLAQKPSSWSPSFLRSKT
ncbi:hypothetical protein B566_EDAN008893 [Ephemera danica]|nr:hypothetical protein B566_EDAN008893 [Ephemera danica]